MTAAPKPVAADEPATGDEPVAYQYFVLQAVPRPERGECVNVAVVLYAELADVLALAWEVDPDRLRLLDPDVDVDAIRESLDYLASWCAQPLGRNRQPCAAVGPVPESRRPGARFGWLAAARSTILRPGPVHGGVCRDPRAEVNRLLDRLVRT